MNYFSDNLLAVAPKISPKKSIKELEKTAQRIAETFNTDDFQFQSKVKSAIFNNLEESNELSPEKLANDLFDNNLTARLSFIDQVKEAVPEPVQFDEIDASRQLKKFENQNSPCQMELSSSFPITSIKMLSLLSLSKMTMEPTLS